MQRGALGARHPADRRSEKFSGLFGTVCHDMTFRPHKSSHCCVHRTCVDVEVLRSRSSDHAGAPSDMGRWQLRRCDEWNNFELTCDKIIARCVTPGKLIFTTLAGITGWSFCAMPGPAQSTLPPEGSKVQFALTATDGTSVTEQSYRGKWLVIYFGYTFCPDVCPTSMMEIAGALAALGRPADVVQAIFITVDPQRDTPTVLNDGVAHAA
jgi:hypothetical protein